MSNNSYLELHPGEDELLNSKLNKILIKHNIDTKLPYVINRRDLPYVPGVYIIVSSNNSILYIGETNNLNQRFRNHHKSYEIPNYDKCKVAFIKRELRELVSLETELITKLKPLYNVQLTNNNTFNKQNAIIMKEINRDDLYSSSECIELGLSWNKLKSLVKEGELTLVKSSYSGRANYYYKSEVKEVLEKKERFYEA